jgi:cytochrome c
MLGYRVSLFVLAGAIALSFAARAQAQDAAAGE